MKPIQDAREFTEEEKENLLKSALQYQELGFLLHPCSRYLENNEKKVNFHSMSRNYLRKWTSNEISEQIKQGWTGYLGLSKDFIIIDVDDPKIVEKVENIIPKAIFSVQSHRGKHFYFKNEINLEKTTRAHPIEIITNDVGVYIAGTYHPVTDKPTHVCEPMGGTSQLSQVHMDQLVQMAHSHKLSKIISTKKNNTGYEIGNRNNALASEAFTAGLQKDRLKLIEAVDKAEKSGLSSEEIAATALRQYDMGQKNSKIIERTPLAESDNSDVFWKDRTRLSDQEKHIKTFFQQENIQIRNNIREKKHEIKLPGKIWEPFEKVQISQLQALIQEKAWDYKSVSGSTAQRPYGLPSVPKVEYMSNLILADNEYDAVIEWMINLPQWDGTPRMENTLHKCFNVKNDEYHKNVSKMIFTAIVGLNFRLVDSYQYILAIVGPQHAGKSTFAQTLVPKCLPYFNDSIDIRGDERDLATHLSTEMVVESAEMVGVAHSDVEHVKKIISASSRKYVDKYEKFSSEKPQRAIIIATANDKGDGVLPPDITGYRRWLPVLVKEVNPARVSDWLEENLDQLYAEAMHPYRNGDLKHYSIIKLPEKLWEYQEDKARDVAYRANSVLSKEVLMIIGNIHEQQNRDHIMIDEILHDGMGNVRPMMRHVRSPNVIANILRNLGYQPVHKRIGNVWVNPNWSDNIEIL